jgi:hypothetical protein
MQRSSVDLPQPDGPMNAVMRRSARSSEMSSSARVSPYQSESRSTRIDGFSIAGGRGALGAVTTNYAVENVDFNEPGSNASALGRFCRGCHPDFHGGAYDSNMYDGLPGSGAWLRHPTAGANIGALGGEHSDLGVFASRPYRVQVMSPSGNWGTPGVTWTGAPNNLSPSCMSCHKAHGNQNPFGLIFLEGTGPVTEEGDAAGNVAAPAQRIVSLCGQCHAQ